jgi:tetratricopeptide (TPR) repeat protein
LARKTKAAFDKAVALDGDNVAARDGLLQFYMLAPGFMGGSMAKADEQGREIKRRNAYLGGMALATLANRRKDLVSVERELKAVTAAYPDSINPVASLINLYSANARWTDVWGVVDALEKGRLSSHPRVAFLVGRLAAMSGQQLARGEAALTQYLAKPPGRGEPRHAAAQVRLAQLLEKQGRVEPAKAAYRAALAQDPKNEEAKKGLKVLEQRSSRAPSS